MNSEISQHTNHLGISFEDTQTAFSLKSDLELKRSYMLFATMNYPWLVKMGTSSIKTAFAVGLPIKSILRQTLFAHFCGGEDIEDCTKTIKLLAEHNIGTVLDYSVEGEKTEKGFDITEKETLETIYKAAESPSMPFCVFKVTGIASTPLLEKVQRGDVLTPEEEKAWQRAKQRVDTICQTAYKKRVRIFIDAEETWIQGTIDAFAEEMMTKYNKELPIVYNTYQMYLSAKYAQLEADLQKAKDRNYFLGAKLVRGAYMEKERKRAEKKGYPSPIQPDKASSDRDFNKALAFCVANRDKIALVAGTHNEESSLYLTKLLAENNIKSNDANFYFAQLFGMSDHISFNLAKAGYNVAKYVPYGPVKAVIPYLFRRAEENTSVAGQSSREFTLIQKEMKRRRRES
ncbi:MAG: proline dehydrogenase family protein [Flammeovirgaceae bacterium]